MHIGETTAATVALNWLHEFRTCGLSCGWPGRVDFRLCSPFMLPSMTRRCVGRCSFGEGSEGSAWHQQCKQLVFLLILIAVRAFYWLRQQSALSFGKHILPKICNAKICKGLNILNVFSRAHMPPGQFAVLPLRHRGSSQTWACQHPSFAQQETSNMFCALQSKSTLVNGWILCFE